MTEDLQRTIENSVTGGRVTFLATAEKTNGEYLRIRNETSAGASQDRLKECVTRGSQGTHLFGGVERV